MADTPAEVFPDCPDCGMSLPSEIPTAVEDFEPHVFLCDGCGNIWYEPTGDGGSPTPWWKREGGGHQ